MKRTTQTTRKTIFCLMLLGVTQLASAMIGSVPCGTNLALKYGAIIGLPKQSIINNALIKGSERQMINMNTTIDKNNSNLEHKRTNKLITPIQQTKIYSCCFRIRNYGFVKFKVDSINYITNDSCIRAIKSVKLFAETGDRFKEIKRGSNAFFLEAADFAVDYMTVGFGRSDYYYHTVLSQDLIVSNINADILNRKLFVSFNAENISNSKLKIKINAITAFGDKHDIAFTQVSTNHYEAELNALSVSYAAIDFIIEDKKGNIVYKKEITNNLSATIAYPTLVKDLCTIQTTYDNAICEVFDINGAFKFSKVLSIGDNSINLSQLANGLVLIRIRNQQKVLETLKVIKVQG
jgi:hypothetical protein